MSIFRAPLVVVCWAQDGCPSCDAFVPKFQRVAARYASCVPAAVLSADRNAAAADHYRVVATPTTHILRWGRRTLRWLDGDAAEPQIDALFQFAMRGQDCQVGPS